MTNTSFYLGSNTSICIFKCSFNMLFSTMTTLEIFRDQHCWRPTMLFFTLFTFYLTRCVMNDWCMCVKLSLWVTKNISWAVVDSFTHPNYLHQSSIDAHLTSVDIDMKGRHGWNYIGYSYFVPDRGQIFLKLAVVKISLLTVFFKLMELRWESIFSITVASWWRWYMHFSFNVSQKLTKKVIYIDILDIFQYFCFKFWG